ncbi:purine/pyrimidine permease [Alcaligenaceae bacterium]|nr:purine/pyrimidine permease [Alcaligenaceae bacterium]
MPFQRDKPRVFAGLPRNPPFRRPHDLVYASNERPPMVALTGLALQHVATALALIAYVLASAKIAGLDADGTRSMVTATILGMAIATFLQSWGGRMGSGLLLVHMPDPLLVLLSGMVAAEYGVGGLVMVGAVNGLVAMGAGFVVPRLRAILPPTVAGVVVCVAGLSLITPALTHTGGLNGTGGVDAMDALVGGATLAVIVALSIWGNHQAKLFALLAGLIVGIGLSAALGQLEGLDALTKVPVIAPPHLPTPVFQIDPGVLAAVAVLALMTQLDTFGCVVLMHKMNDADWRRPEMRMVGGGIRASGMANFLAAWLGAYPTAISSANIALSHISRSTSRWIGLAAAALLGLAAFLPQVSLALTLIPTPVIGAVEVYAAAYLIVSGVELIASRAMDSRGIFMVGIAFVLGVGLMFMPELSKLAPTSLQFIAGNGIIVAGLTAITLNLLFRLGTSQREQQALPGDDPATASRLALAFIEENGARWSARREAVRRAAQAALEAVEAIQTAGGGRQLQAIRGSFDEFNLDIELLHAGPPLQLGDGKPHAHAELLDIDDHAFMAALDETMAGVAQVLLRRLADRVSSGIRGEQSYLRLHFDH